MRQLGDALRAWHERLNVQDVSLEAEDVPQEEAAAPPSTEANADAYAYTQDDTATDVQATGAATQEQLEAQQQAAPPEEEDGGGKDATEETPVEEPLPAEDTDITVAAGQLPESAAEEAQAEEEDDEEKKEEEAGAEAKDPTRVEAPEAMDEEEDGDHLDNWEPVAPGRDGAAPQSNGRTHLGAAEGESEGDDASDSGASDDQAANDEEEHVLSPEEERALRSRLEAELDQLQREEAQREGSAEALARAQSLWQRYEQLTGHLSNELCEQLRLVLTESQASKMRGDFRTGKRLNMRKIIPYIASQFRKDKIWLRRTKPSKREYQVLLAVDDSKSMALYHSRQMALEALCTLSGALGKLEVGELGVMGFGERPALIHRLDEPFTPFSGAKCLQRLTFAQQRTAVGDFLAQTGAILADARASRARQPDLAVSQLLFVLSDSDNLYQEGQAAVERGVRKLKDQGVFVVFVILDAPEKEHSVMQQKSVSFVGGRVVTEDYMDRFRDKNYIVLQDLGSLPERLGDALRQWFEMVSAQ